MSQRWDRIKELFQRAVDLSADQRAALFDLECAGDPELRREVESLIDSDQDTPALLHRTARDAFTELAGAALVDGFEPGQMVGRYRLLERVGAGGMGTVWKAEDQRDGGHVAVKFVRHSMNAPSLLGRFDNERRLMAHLDHPNIARLLDGGMTDDGRPYLVVEYVDGLPIDRWCAERKLGVPGRLELFQQVCAAVHEAHRNLIVHRDLKPGNVLVAADGQPKLVDFGISKIIHPETGLATATLTEWRPMTPQYASPEQIRGEPMTTTSDIYSLGVMLYELLAGKRPYEVPSAWRPEAEKVITEASPPPPSAVAGARQLAGDLDNIVLMAMRQEPGRRYASALQLGEDLDRYLQGLPVRARPETFAYRLSKLWKRNKLAVSAGVLLLVLLLGGSLMVARQARIAERERDFAQAEAESLHRVVDFLSDLFHTSDPSSAFQAVSPRELLDRGLASLRADMAVDPAVRSALLLSIGRIYLELGLRETAAPALEEAHRLRLEVYGPDHVEIAEIRNALGRLRHAQGRFGEAEEHLRAAHRVWSERWGEDHLDVAAACNNLGLLLRDTGQLEEAAAILARAVQVRQGLLGPSHLRTLGAQNNLASVRYSLGDLEGAEALLREVVAGHEALARGQDDLALANAVNNLGLMLHEQDRLVEAEGLYLRAHGMRGRLLEAGHPSLAGSLNNLGGVRYMMGDPAGAEARFREAVAEFRLRGEEGNPTLAQFQMNLARALRDQGRAEEAEVLLGPVLARQRESLPPGHPLLSSLLAVHGGLLADLGLLEEARAELEEARRLILGGEGDPALKLGPVEEELGRVAEAESRLGS